MGALTAQEDELADWEEAAGISAPLYEIVDCLFELQSRGFFRRQVWLSLTRPWHKLHTILFSVTCTVSLC